jgi:hypothetical protein
VVAAEGERAAEREARDVRVEAKGSGVRWLQTCAGVKVYGGKGPEPEESGAGLEGEGWVER